MLRDGVKGKGKESIRGGLLSGQPALPVQEFPTGKWGCGGIK